jgi:hypothetical protein
MAHQFKKHYTVDEARQLLPQIRQWLGQLVRLRDQLRKSDLRGAASSESDRDLGGALVNAWVRQTVDFRRLLLEFQGREIQIKDFERGLVDFPAIVAGKEVFLCWESGEDDIEFWHDLDSGYSGRERL